MLLVLCVDLDDDLGRKTGHETPVVGREAVESAAVDLAAADPEDSDVNVLFEGVHIHDRVDEAVEVAAVTGVEEGGVAANRKVGDELDEVLAGLKSGEPVSALVVTDGAQDESVLPVVRSRVTVDGVHRVVVRQAQDLESMYYTIKQVLAAPQTRGTILVPLGILLLIYPLAVLADFLGLPGFVLGVSSALLGLYLLFRGLGVERMVDDAVAGARNLLYAGRATLITYVVAAALVAVAGVEGLNRVEGLTEGTGIPTALAAFAYGAVRWVALAALTSSLGQITDEYLAGRLEWRYLNAPFYVVAIAVVGHALSGFFLGEVTLPVLAGALAAGTLLGVLSTLTFAVVESRRERAIA
jgi:putative membrane protein